MRGLLAVVAAAAVVACTPAASTPAPSDESAITAPGSDVLTYKGDSARTGVMPGPGISRQPEILWEHHLDAAVAAAPLVAGSRLVITGADGVVRVIDLVTGVEDRIAQLPDGTSSTPTISGSTLLVITEDGILRTISLEDHGLGWTADGFLPASIVTVVGGIVLAGAPGEVVALAIDDGRELWRAAAPGSDRVAVAGEVGYVAGDGSGLLSTVGLDGSPGWRRETGGARVLTPAVTAEAIYVVARDVPGGGNVLFALDPSGAERWTWRPLVDGRIGGHAVAGDMVIVTTDNPIATVSAVWRADGRTHWVRELAGEMVGIPVIADQHVYVASGSDGVVAIDLATGEPAWQVPLGRTAGAGLAVTDGLVLVTTRDPDGGGRVIVLADGEDPRVAGSTRPTATPRPSPPPAALVRVLGVDTIGGRTLLIGVAVAPDGTRYVGDMVNSRIVIRHPDGSIEMWGERGSEDGQFDFSEVTQNDGSVGVAVSPDGELIAVGDGGNHRVQLFDADRRFLHAIGRLGRSDGQFVNPCCVTIDSGHRVWVVDTARADVQVFDPDGRHLRTFAGPGIGDGELNRPGTAFIDEARGEVLIPDFGNRRVSVFSMDGEWLRHYRDRPADGFVLDEVNVVAVDRFGRLLIVDATNRIFIVGRDGALEATIPNRLPDVGPTEITGLSIDGSGRTYLTDPVGGRLIVVQLEPAIWPEGPAPSPGA